MYYQDELFTRYSLLCSRYLILVTHSFFTCYHLLVTLYYFLATFCLLLVTTYSLLFTLLFICHYLFVTHYFLLIVFFINFYYLLVKLWKLSDVKNLKISYHASNLNNGRSKEFQNLLYLSINNFKSSRNAVKLIRKAYVSPH